MVKTCFNTPPVFELDKRILDLVSQPIGSPVKGDLRGFTFSWKKQTFIFLIWKACLNQSVLCSSIGNEFLYI